MKKYSINSLKDKFYNELAQDKWVLMMNGVRRDTKESVGEVLSIDKVQKNVVGEYTLEDLHTGIEIGGRKVSIVIDNRRSEPTEYLKVDHKSELFYLDDLYDFGKELFCDYDIGQFFITYENDKFIVFKREYVYTPAFSHEKGKVDIVDQDAANYMFRKRFDKLYISYFEKGKKYIEITEKFLNNLNNFIEKKELDKSKVKLLFLDRDAIIFEYIAKRISENFGFRKNQFEGLLIPQDLEFSIREANETDFHTMYAQGIAHYRGDTAPHGTHKQKLDIPASSALDTYGKYLNQLDLGEQIPIIIDGGIIGTSIRIARDLIEHFHPELKVYSGLIYGQKDETAQYRDFTSQYAGIKDTQAFLERRPKHSLRLLKLKETKNGKIIPIRGRAVMYNEEVYEKGLDVKSHLQQVMLDENKPLKAEVFQIALNHLLCYKEKGVDIDSGAFERQKRRRDTKLEKKYGL